MDKLVEKLKKILGKLGLDDAKIESIVEEVKAEEEPKGEDVESEEIVESTNEVAPTDEPLADEPTPEVAPKPTTPEGEGEHALAVEPEPVETVEGDVAPTDEPTPTEPLPAPAIEGEINPADIVPESEGQPLSPDPTPAPSIEPDMMVELQSKLDAQTELNEGLKARIDALEEALRKSGIMEDVGVEQSGVGFDSSATPANNPIDDPMEDVLHDINHRR